MTPISRFSTLSGLPQNSSPGCISSIYLTRRSSMRKTVDEDIPESKSSEEGQAFFDQGIVDEAQMRLSREYEGRMGDFKSYTFVIACGSPEIEIIRYARKNDIDLIVMGALGKAEVDKLEHGSTVANVSRYAHCHVMAIRNPLKQFTLPIKG